MAHTHIFKFAALLIATSLYCTPSLATDIAREVRGDSGNNFFEVTAGVGCGQSDRKLEDSDDNESCGAGLGFGGEYHWKGLFIEAIQDAYSGLNIGYTLYQSNAWSLDLIGFNVNGRVTDDDEGNLSTLTTEAERNKYLLNRDTVAINGGLRATHYWQDNIIQFRLESDYSQKHAGPQGSFLLGRAWQLRNWNIHGLVGLHWHSRKRTQYWWNVSEEEATTRFPEYSASSALNYSFEIGATYPISEHWVSRTRAVIFLLDDTISESPLAYDDWSGGIDTTISYVF